MVRVMYWAWLLPLVALEAAAQSTMCSTSNTASSGPNSNIFQSKSACVNICKGQTAYAVVQYDKCWCSNTSPSSTTDGGNCNKPCPGYPPEMCGGDSQFAYVLLDKSKIEAAPSSAPPPASSSPPAPSQQQQQQQQQHESSAPPSPAATDSPPASQQPPPPPQIITITQTNVQGSKTIIKTVQASPSVVEDSPATLRTVTVTGTLAVTTDAGAPSNSTPSAAAQSSSDSGSVNSVGSFSNVGSGSGNSNSGLKQGTIVGIAVGGSAAGVFMGLVAFMIWRRSRYRTDRDSQAAEANDVGYFGPSTTTIRRDNTSASEDSRMGAFGQNKHLCRNSIGSLEDMSLEMNQVLRVVNPDMEEKM